MAPWQMIVDEYEGSQKVLVGNVDCSRAGASLCARLRVGAFPSIKFGDPSKHLEWYFGGHEYHELKTFAASKLGPSCGPTTMNACEGEKLENLKVKMAMSEKELNKFIYEAQNRAVVIWANNLLPPKERKVFPELKPWELHLAKMVREWKASQQDSDL